jgi:hypothetical protein
MAPAGTQELFCKSIQQSVERLLAPDNADIVTGHAFKPSHNQGFGFGQLGSAVQFVLDCRPDGRTRASRHSWISFGPRTSSCPMLSLCAIEP